MAEIPPRDPVGDTFDGVLVRYTSAYFLAPEPLPETEILAEGVFTVRYGVRYMEKTQLAVVPGLLALDYGEMLTGEAMWEFMLTRNNLYPRADVLGYRNDGEDVMVVLKRLDLAQAFAVLAYEDPQATVPLATLEGVIAPKGADLPERLVEYSERYENIEDWKQRE